MKSILAATITVFILLNQTYANDQSVAEQPKPCGQAPFFLKAKIGMNALTKTHSAFLTAMAPDEGNPFLRMCESFRALCPINSIWKKIKKSSDSIEQLGQSVSQGLALSQTTCVSAESTLNAAEKLGALSASGPAELLAEMEKFVSEMKKAQTELQADLANKDKMSMEEQEKFKKKYHGVDMEIATTHAQESAEKLSTHLGKLEALSHVPELSQIISQKEELQKRIDDVINALNSAAEKAIQ